MGIAFDKTTALDLASLTQLYRDGELTPGALVAGLIERIEARGEDKVWIHRLTNADLMTRAAELEKAGPEGLPLYGIPFAIKDNMDVAGLPCPPTPASRSWPRSPGCARRRRTPSPVNRVWNQGQISTRHVEKRG